MGIRNRKFKLNLSLHKCGVGILALNDFDHQVGGLICGVPRVLKEGNTQHNDEVIVVQRRKRRESSVNRVEAGYFDWLEIHYIQHVVINVFLLRRKVKLVGEEGV